MAGVLRPCAHPRPSGLQAAGNVVEFGCGYGLFTVEAAKRSSGTAYALDIDPEMIAATTEAARKAGVTNVQPTERDFVIDGTGLLSESCDYAMVFNLLHIDEPVTLLREAFRVPQPGGKLGIIHWNIDPATPRGSSMAIRPTPEQCRRWAEEAGFRHVREEPGIATWHWGLLMQRLQRGTRRGLFRDSTCSPRLAQVNYFRPRFARRRKSCPGFPAGLP